LPAIPNWAAAWANRDGCALTSHESYHLGDVSAATWDGCKGGVTVTLYTITGGGHAWPGSGLATATSPDREINATDLIWKFFTSYALPDQ